jgi:subtilisin family serine protease
VTFRRSVPAVIATAVLSALFPAASAPATAEPQPPSGIASLITKADKQGTIRVIVQTSDMDHQADLQNALGRSRANYQIRTQFQKFPLVAMDVDSATLKMLGATRGVVRVVEDTLDKPSLAETIPLIHADKVHARGGTGAHQTVVVIDTGVDRNHPFLAGRLVAEACYSAGNGAASQSLCPNGDSSQAGAGAADAKAAGCQNGTTNLCIHGTHVAGIAAGRKVAGAPGDGVAPGANIIAIQVFSRHNTLLDCGLMAPPCLLSYMSDQLLGLQKVVELADKYSIASVNMSLGSSGANTAPCDGDMRKMGIDALLKKGVATVIAAGNSGATGVGAPGCISSAVTVGATDDHDAVASFSDRGPMIDLFAPGVNVKSSMPGGTYKELSGTSMATPHVAGAFAVLKQANPTASVADLVGALQRTGKSITMPDASGTGEPPPGPPPTDPPTPKKKRDTPPIDHKHGVRHKHRVPHKHRVAHKHDVSHAQDATVWFQDPNWGRSSVPVPFTRGVIGMGRFPGHPRAHEDATGASRAEGPGARAGRRGRLTTPRIDLLAAWSAVKASAAVPKPLPSLQPALPTAVPTLPPPGIPTAPPSGIPTDPPSGIPSSLPSLVPSILPSSLPGASRTSPR